MNRAEAALADYQAYHRSFANKVTHYVGIPLIVFSLIGMLQHVGLGTVAGFALDASYLLLLVATAYYLYLDWRFAASMLAVAGLMLLVAPTLPLMVHVGIQVAGWILQFIGHGVYEGQRPAFLKNLTHLLVGPVWILNDILGFIPPERYRDTANTAQATV